MPNHNGPEVKRKSWSHIFYDVPSMKLAAKEHHAGISVAYKNKCGVFKQICIWSTMFFSSWWMADVYTKPNHRCISYIIWCDSFHRLWICYYRYFLVRVIFQNADLLCLRTTSKLEHTVYASTVPVSTAGELATDVNGSNGFIRLSVMVYIVYKKTSLYIYIYIYIYIHI